MVTVIFLSRNLTKNGISFSPWLNKRALWYEQSINKTITVRMYEE